MVLKKVRIEDLDQLKAWSFIMNENPQFGRYYRNPVRTDKQPGCKFVKKDQVLLLMDFSGNSKYKGMDAGLCWSLVKGLSYQEAINDLFIKTGSFVNQFKGVKSSRLSDIKLNIEVYEKEYSQQFIDYWGQWGIEPERLTGRVKDVEKYSIKGENRKSTYYPRDLAIAYQGQKGHKLYFPYRDKPRFKSDIGKEDVWVTERNPKRWIITKSHKDFLFIEKITEDTEYSIGMVQSENSFPTNKLWEDAYDLNVLFDNDKSGIVGMDNFRDFYLNSRSLILPTEEKDLTDFALNYGITAAGEVLFNLLLNY